MSGKENGAQAPVRLIDSIFPNEEGSEKELAKAVGEHAVLLLGKIAEYPEDRDRVRDLMIFASRFAIGVVKALDGQEYYEDQDGTLSQFYVNSKDVNMSPDEFSSILSKILTHTSSS